MSLRIARWSELLARLSFVLCLVAAVPAFDALGTQQAFAQAGDDDDDDGDDDGGGDDDDGDGTNGGINGIFISSGAVGGVSVDAAGLLRNARVDLTAELRKLREQSIQPAAGDVARWSDLRKVSLARLEAALHEYLSSGKPLPEEVLYLGGLQRVEYVFVYPEEKDIVLAGPAEGWKVDAERSELVGLTTGRPVMLLDDLMIALRTAELAAQGGISCSIDPTPEGLVRLQTFLKTHQQMSAGLVDGIEQNLGPQVISVTGVPATSHFARVLVAADYRMKRLAMDLDPSPVAGLPSFLGMMKSGRSGMQNAMPRWWLATAYDALTRDPEGLTWHLQGQGVRCESEEDFLAAGGQLERGARANPQAQRWAELMTAKYEELAAVDPIFGQLRNVMDLAVISALIVKEDLTGKAGYSMPLLLNPTELPAVRFKAPKQVSSQASVIKRSRDWIVSASGGVSINSWQVASQSKTDETLGDVRGAAAGAQQRHWWWD